MNDEEALTTLIEQLVVAFPDRPRQQVERVTSAAWFMVGSTAANEHARVRVTEWYARTELTAGSQRPSPN